MKISALDSALQALYERHCQTPGSTNPLLPRLRALASECDTVVELGTKHGRSATAFLMAGCEVWSYDIVESKHARALQKITGKRWHYTIADTRRIEIPECDLIFFDSLHTYGQLDAELRLHASKSRRFLVFHDTITFGVVGARGEDGVHSWTFPQPVQEVPPEHRGIRLAIDEMMVREPCWRIREHVPTSHGLLILEREV